MGNLRADAFNLPVLGISRDDVRYDSWSDFCFGSEDFCRILTGKKKVAGRKEGCDGSDCHRGNPCNHSGYVFVVQHVCPGCRSVSAIPFFLCFQVFDMIGLLYNPDLANTGRSDKCLFIERGYISS